MSSLGFTKLYPNSCPIAVISGGTDNKKIVYINPRQFGADALKKRYIDFYEHKKLLKHYKPKEKEEILHYFNQCYHNKEDMIEDVKLNRIYNDIIEIESSKKSFDKLKLQTGAFFKPYPIGDCFSVTYCYGQSGSGKSFYANMYASNYLQLYPDNKVYLITHPEAPDDPAFEDLKIIRLNINKFIDNPPILEDFNDSLVVFDDYENIAPKPLNEIVHKLIDNIASLGRKRHIIVIPKKIVGKLLPNTQLWANHFRLSRSDSKFEFCVLECPGNSLRCPSTTCITRAITWKRWKKRPL